MLFHVLSRSQKYSESMSVKPIYYGNGFNCYNFSKFFNSPINLYIPLIRVIAHAASAKTFLLEDNGFVEICASALG